MFVLSVCLSLSVRCLFILSGIQRAGGPSEYREASGVRQQGGGRTCLSDREVRKLPGVRNNYSMSFSSVSDIFSLSSVSDREVRQLPGVWNNYPISLQVPCVNRRGSYTRHGIVRPLQTIDSIESYRVCVDRQTTVTDRHGYRS